MARAEDGAVTLRHGVAPERRISIEDADMRHGRKSRHQRIDGYKGHVLRNLDTGLVRAVGVTALHRYPATSRQGLNGGLGERLGASPSARGLGEGCLSMLP